MSDEIVLTETPAISVVYGGKKYPLRRPKMKEAKQLFAAIKQAQEKDESSIDAIVEIVTLLGFPKDVADEMDMGTFMDMTEKVMEQLIPKKK